MLQKCLSRYYFIQLNQKLKKIKLRCIGFGLLFVSYKIIKFSVVTYYYFMWEVDIRKPKTSDYIIERFR